MCLTCPACGKTGQTACRCARCGCDLSPLQTVAWLANVSLARSHQALRTRNWRPALDLAAQSWRLRRSRSAARLAFLAASALGETAAALSWHAFEAECASG